MGRARGRSLDPETALRISVAGAARRLAEDNMPVADAVDQLRTIVGDRTEVLAHELGMALGGFLGTPLSNPLDLKAAHLLSLAGGYEHYDTMIAAADLARRGAGGAAYSL